MNELNKVVRFFFETGMLERFKRSGFDFLGTGSQNIAAHSFRTAVIGYTLAAMTDGADKAKTALICLFHDIPETRTGDINYFQKKYVEKDETKAINDIADGLPIEDELKSYITQYEGDSIESVLSRDADVLELIFTLKEELDKGNKQAEFWINNALKRLETETAKAVAAEAISQASFSWWGDVTWRP